MNPILHQLWEDHAEEIFRQFDTPQIKAARQQLLQHQAQLDKTLDPAQKELWETCDDLYTDLQALYFDQIFAGAFRLGVQLLLAGLTRP